MVDNLTISFSFKHLTDGVLMNDDLFFVCRKRVQKKFQKYTWSFGIDEAGAWLDPSWTLDAVGPPDLSRALCCRPVARMMKASAENASSWRPKGRC